jgi:hypothetical protein
MDEKTADMEDEESAQPQNNQNHSENEKHL